jgi:hypothetical protein
VARTVVDVARSVSTLAAVVTIDAALNRGLIESEQLEDLRYFCRSWPGMRKASRALALADARAESPLESFSRLVIRQLKLPTPDLQTSFYDHNGNFLGRTDFYWDEFGVVGEADGRSKYDQRDVLTAEKLRQEDLEERGVAVVRWGWTDARYRQVYLGQRITRAFDRGRRRDRSGFPRL